MSVHASQRCDGHISVCDSGGLFTRWSCARQQATTDGTANVTIGGTLYTDAVNIIYP